MVSSAISLFSICEAVIELLKRDTSGECSEVSKSCTDLVGIFLEVDTHSPLEDWCMLYKTCFDARPANKQIQYALQIISATTDAVVRGAQAEKALELAQKLWERHTVMEVLR